MLAGEGRFEPVDQPVAPSKARATSSKRRPFDPATSKYDFRVFLLGLGLVGDEFKTARFHLLRNLGGSAGWKGARRDRASRVDTGKLRRRRTHLYIKDGALAGIPSKRYSDVLISAYQQFGFDAASLIRALTRLETPVFVYGTLRQGESNHYLLEDREPLGLSRTRASFDLLGLGSFPGLVAGTAVVGEVYMVTLPSSRSSASSCGRCPMRGDDSISETSCPSGHFIVRDDAIQRYCLNLLCPPQTYCSPAPA